MKLVRDKIPDIIIQSGRTCAYHVATEAEYKVRLYDKMVEEVAEFRSSPSEEEAADIYEVFFALCSFYGLSMEVVENIAAEKRAERGPFIKRLVLEKVDEGR